MRECANCGAPFEWKQGRGRPRLYCSRACRPSMSRRYPQAKPYGKKANLRRSVRAFDLARQRVAPGR